MSQRYLITGCAGFIASSVSRMLLEAGHEVVGVDNLSDAYDRRLKWWRLQELRGTPGFRFVHGDVSVVDEMRDVFKVAADRHGQPPFAAVINLAARAGVRDSVTDPWIYYQTNTSGTLNLLDCCRQFRVPKFVLASTSSLYGAGDTLPYHEELPTDKPLSPYAASKKAAETLAYTYHHLHGIDITALRYFTVYGPAGRPDMSVFRFIRAAMLGHTVTIFGDGEQERDFTYVDDIARGTIAALAPVGYQVFNLGGDRPIPLSHLMHEIEKQVGRRIRTVHAEAHAADPRKTWADISKARNLLQWSPEVSIESGLAQTIRWFREYADLSLKIDTGEKPTVAAA